MNRYTVVSSPEAEAQLTNIWVNAADRSSVTAAQHLIDRMLSTDPLRYGALVAEDLWRIEVFPLRAYFEIRELDRLVKILSIYYLS